jgi:hypothetical protein
MISVYRKNVNHIRKVLMKLGVNNVCLNQRFFIQKNNFRNIRQVWRRILKSKNKIVCRLAEDITEETLL